VKKICFIFIFTFAYSNQELEIEIKQSLVSPCCWAGTIYDLDHNPEMENKISELIKSGYSKSQVLEYFVNIHGERVLAVPKAEGFNTLVWIAPIIVIIGSLIFLSMFFSKQKHVEKISNKKSELLYMIKLRKNYQK
tara:strand:+ start:2492 stop:2899 length:408 start_codon:yes stop_codon:yes gene_type:complete